MILLFFRHVETALQAMDSSIEELGAGNLVQGHLASQQAIQQVQFVRIFIIWL